MKDSITPKQTLILWCLLGRQGQAFQKDIVPKVERHDREALVSRGLVASSKVGQSIFLKVEDKGWRWAGEHLTDELPRGFQVLRDWLSRLGQYLSANNNRTLAGFIGPAPELPSAPSAKRGALRPSPAKAISGQELRARIEQAYLIVTSGQKAEGALLTKVREQLSDLDRTTVDAGLLRILQGDEKARLSQISDPKALTPQDHAAAFSPAGEPFHLLWIQP